MWQFILALVVVFAIGMGIRYLFRKLKPGSGGKITITPKIDIQQTSAPTPPPSQAAFCPNCGTKIEGGSAFCGNCGAKVA